MSKAKMMMPGTDSFRSQGCPLQDANMKKRERDGWRVGDERQVKRLETDLEGGKQRD